MVRNSEKKMTRKIRKNRQTRRKRVLKMKTKFRKNRMHKTMKVGGYTTLREKLKSTGELGTQINLHLNLIANSIAENKADENPQGGNFLRFLQCYKIELERTAPKQEWTPVTPAVTPAADSTPMIQFIPDSFLGEIRYTIQVLIKGIHAEYSKLCDSTSSNRMNPCGEGYQLTPDRFEEMLHKVCMGEVHKRKCLGGGICSFINYGITNFNKLQTSLSNMYNMLEKPNPDYSNHNTTFGSIPSPPEGNKLNFTIMLQLDQLDQSDRVSLSVSSSVLQIYSKLNTLLNNDLLDPDKIICKACTIVMPPFKKKSVYIGHNAHLLSPITYGYRSLTTDRVFRWEVLRGEQLEPNSYCADRKNKRVMETVSSKLSYTMSPLVIPRELLPPESLRHYDIQSQHQSWLDNMVQMLANLDRNISKKDMLKGTFDTDEKVEMTHIFDENEIYYYYELKIQKTTIPVKSADNSDTNIKAVIIEFKVFSEDGICSKEIIFVSYERPSPTDAFSVLPGTVIDNVQVQVQVSPGEMNRAIHTLFIQKFMELLYSIGTAPSDNVVLSLTDSAGQLVERGPTSEISNTQPEILQPLPPGSTYTGICTIILKNSGTTFGLSVAKATDNQIAAFHAVNNHIETRNPYGRQTTFQINNNKTGVDEIKVTVRILTVDKGASNRLLSATYQAQDSVPYLLFANAAEAQKHIESKMMI